MVLNRKVGEVIWIGEIKLTVIDSTPGRVRLGFEGDRSVEIYREELLPEGHPARTAKPREN